MDQILEVIKAINIDKIIVILLGTWIFYYRLGKKPSNVEVRLNKRIEKLSEIVEDIDRRLCRIEGVLPISEHCLFQQSSHEKKAE